MYLDVREYYGLIMIRLSTLKSGRKLVTDSDTETWVETSWAWGTWGYSVISITTSGNHQGNTRLFITVSLRQSKLIVICGYFKLLLK